MKAVLCFGVVCLGAVAVVSDMAGECLMAGFYLELGCTPVPADDNSTCPVAFTCPDLHPDPTMCYYRGAAYGNGSPIPDSEIQASCSQVCSCRVSGTPRIECAAVDCVEIFDSDAEQCVTTFELNSCCSTNKVCGKDALLNLATCEVDGKSYYAGQQFEPKNTGKSCICSAEWDGRSDNTTQCRDINCGLELHFQSEILGKCAPVLYTNRICPIAFQCPTPTTKIIRGLNLRNNAAECAFGNDTLRVGDEVSVDDKCMSCTCQMPPFVSCKRKNNCDQEPAGKNTVQ